MKNFKKAITLNVALALMGSAVFAQSLDDAKKAMDAEQYQKATSMLKALVNNSPKKGENYYNLGVVYLKTGYLDSAKAVFNQGLTADPKYASNYAGLGEADLLENNIDASKANFDKAISIAKKDYKTYLAIGRAYLAQNKPDDEVSKPDFESALANLIKADELDSKDKDAEVFIALGDAYALQKKNSDALGPYMQAHNIDPNNHRSSVQIGRMYKESRAFPEGESEIQRAIEADPNYGPAYRELAELYMQWSNFGSDKEKVTKAIENYKKYLDLTDTSFESQLRYVQFLSYARDFQTLAQVLPNIQSDPSNSRSFVIDRLRGWSAFENGQYADALKFMTAFTSSVDKSKLLGLDYLYLGKAQLKEGQDEAALVNLTKAVEIDSSNFEPLADLAKSYYDAKRYDKAVEVYQLVNKYNPEGKGSLYNFYYLGVAAYFEYGKGYEANTNPSKDLLKTAVEAFQHVYKVAPTTVDALLWSARANTLLDDNTEPQGLNVADYQKYIDEVEPTLDSATPAVKRNIVEAYNSIAHFAVQKNDREKAKALYTKVLAIEPENAIAADALKALNPAPTKKK